MGASGFLYGLMVAALVTGCGVANRPVTRITAGSGEGLPTASEAAHATYRYAFSAQVLDGRTGTALKEFSVSLLSEDPSVNAIINGMGDRTGIFHISRNPGAQDPAIKQLPVLISAPGHEPVLQLVDVGADCQAGNCPGVKPLLLTLLGEAAAGAVPKSRFNPSQVTQAMANKSTAAIFQELAAAGKLDPKVQQLFAGAKNGDTLKDILVLLDTSATSGQSDALINDLINSTSPNKLQGLAGGGQLFASLVPALAAGSPEVSVALMAANLLLPYLNQKLEGKNGPLANLVKSFVSDPNAQQSLVSLIQSIANKDKKGTAQYAMATLMPLLQGLLAKKGAADTNPFANLLLKSFTDPAFFDLVGKLKDKGTPQSQKTELLFTYLQPLLQGLVSKNAPEIGYLFNLLLKDGGLAAIKDLPKDATNQEKFAKLLPYIEPLIRGLNSKDAEMIAGLLQSVVNQNNPAAALRDLLIQAGTAQGAQGTQLATLVNTLMPALVPLMRETGPGKQVLAAQLLQGLINGDFKGLQVTKDLAGAPAVIIEGQARDLFKLAQLPNVEKVVALNP